MGTPLRVTTTYAMANPWGVGGGGAGNLAPSEALPVFGCFCFIT